MASKSQKGKFLNQIPTLMNPEGTSMWSALGKMIKGTPDRKPPHPIDTSALSLEEFATHKYANENFYIWLGHSSIYLQIDCLRIFIDPVFSPSTSPVSILGPKAFAFTNNYSTASFPDPDIVIITHDHYDHLDKQAIKDFAEKTKEFIVPLRFGSILQNW